MTETTRYHPLLVLFRLWKLVKNSIFFVVYLFIIKADSESVFVEYGRLLFFAVFGIIFISIILKWFTHKYKLDDQSFHLYNGIFSKSERTIPFSSIQNVNRHTSFFHRMFHVTSTSFETGMTGEEAGVKFEVISQLDSERIEAHIARADYSGPTTVSPDVANIELSSQKETERVSLNRTTHFKPSKLSILKASFTSLSFLVLVPIICSFYFKIDEIFHVKKEAEGLFSAVMSSAWLVIVITIILVAASAVFGIVRTFLKYGKYHISSDNERIYITKGIIEETTFSISKDKVQAIEINQSIMKRLLGLAEVKLISAGSLSLGEDTLEINSLYPFLPGKRAYEMISEILPTYEVTSKMTRLPVKSLWVRLFKPSWIWITATAALFYFKPAVLGIEQAWWILSAVLFITIKGIRVLDFLNTRYTLNDRFVQFKTGSLTTCLFVSKRDKIIEVKVTRNILQKMSGLASIGTINRAKPVRHAGVSDVPLELAASLYQWYMERRREIEVE